MSVHFDVETLSSEQARATRANPVADFIFAAMKTAQNSADDIREDIVADISHLLDCNPKDLAFMFEQDTLPVYDRSIDLPDYRLALSGVYLEAAE